MPLQNIHLSKADFNKFDWQIICADSVEKECHNYSTAYFKKANEFEKNNNVTGQEIFTLLGAITSMMLKSDSFSEPFGPMFVLQGSRSAIVEDFNDKQLDVLREITKDINDPELKARIADVLWITKKDYKVCHIAVESYLESAPALDCLSSAPCRPCYPGRFHGLLPFSKSATSAFPICPLGRHLLYSLTRLLVGSLALRPAASPIGNLRPLVTKTPLP